MKKKFKIVFLPFKASMWDSLESIYLAARNDKDCEPCVVPIPYYEKHRDKSFGRLCYEGGDYPQNIPIADWRGYFKENRPDAIIFHNPYDNNNLITSVHPDFYTRELRKKTDLLVYVNYGITYYEAKTPGHLGYLPSFTFSDISVTHTKEYAVQIKYLIDMNPTFIKNDVVALGSPKFDAVLNKGRDDFTVPPEWREKIKGKKVLLFSTGISEILRDEKAFMRSQRTVFDTFRARGDVVLWWRPHPLTKETIANICPRFLSFYNKMTKDYIEDGFGIYDETADINRAIAWSDACYTDGSSILYLYLATGKPFALRDTGKKLNLQTDNSNDFTALLKTRINSMKAAKGANILKTNYIIWWHCFADADFVNKIEYNNFLDRFLHFTLNENLYPDAKEYREQKRNLLQNAVENADGTAGQKIYDYVRFSLSV